MSVKETYMLNGIERNNCMSGKYISLQRVLLNEMLDIINIFQWHL